MCLQCDVKDEEIFQLKSKLYGWDWEPPRAFQLTTGQSFMLAALMAHARVIPNWLLYQASREAPQTHGVRADTKIVQVQMSHLRRKLKPFGVEINTQWGYGYWLSAETRSKLLSWGSERAAA